MATLTIQPSDIDTYLDLGNPTTNFGTSVNLITHAYSTDKCHPILKFDFSALPAGAIISAATLNTYLRASTALYRTYWAYELTQTGWVETEATWNIYNTGNNWATAGGDYTTTDGASLEVPEINNWMSWNVLALVQHFQSAHGKIAHFLIRDETENANAYGIFHSNNYTTDLSLRPKLIITYTVSEQATDKFFLMFD